MKIKLKNKQIIKGKRTLKKSALKSKKKNKLMSKEKNTVKSFELGNVNDEKGKSSKVVQKPKKHGLSAKNTEVKQFAQSKKSTVDAVTDSEAGDSSDSENPGDIDLMMNETSLKELGMSSDGNISDTDFSQDEEEVIHRPPDELEEASDETDDETASAPFGVVTLKMVEEWREKLKTDKSLSTINTVVDAFHGALNRVSTDDSEPVSSLRVIGSSVFNAVVQLCVLDLQPAIKHFLQLPPGKHKPPHKCKKWVKIKATLRCYLADLLKLLSAVSSEHIISVLLKHLHQMIPFVTNYPNVTKGFVRKLVELWSSGEETIRVLAFICLLRLTTTQQKSLLSKVLKMMYLAFVKNSKFVSPNTLPAINFMRRSLTEMYNLDENVSYQHVFLYIRQLAIHLRNAITVQKKENRQAVCNWQYIESLHLWTELLGVSVNKQQLQQLLYPLVQVVIGTVKLVPSAHYYPLRFHCLDMLIQLSNNAGVFIPILPFLLEVLITYDFNKKHKKVSMKPLDFSSVLRVSKGQMQENGYKNAVIENVYKLLLQYTANESHSIAFPDMVVPAVIQIKAFLKICKNANYTKKIKQVLEKIEENARFIEGERKKISFALSDRKAINAWENGIKLQGTPLTKFYNSWNKMHMQQLAKRATDNVKLGEYNIPVIKKPLKPASNEDGPVELFPSDDSDTEDFFGAETQPQTKRGKRGSGKQPSTKKETVKTSYEIKFEEGDDAEDIVEDFNFSDSE